MDAAYFREVWALLEGEAYGLMIWLCSSLTVWSCKNIHLETNSNGVVVDKVNNTSVDLSV